MRYSIARWLIVFLALTACTPISASPTPTAQSTATVPAETPVDLPLPAPTNTVETSITETVSPLPTATATFTPQNISLPHALYFLRREFNQEEEIEYPQQIWRLSPDGKTLTQITHEASDVQQFDITLEIGWLAYVTAQNDITQLILMKTDGSERQVIFNGQKDDGWGVNNISTPRWSTNGLLLAFHYQGIYFYQFETHQFTKIVEDYVEEPGEPGNEAYIPVEWSPDGKQLVIEKRGWESGQWMVYSLEKKALIDTGSPQSYQDKAVWSADSRMVVFTSAPVMGGICKSLVQFEVATSQQSMLFDCEHEGYGSVGWPTVTASEMLQYFSSEGEQVDSGLPPKWTIAPLPSSTFVGIDEVLWADDGTLVILRLDELGSRSLELVPLDASKPIQLIEPGGSSLHWGP